MAEELFSPKNCGDLLLANCFLRQYPYSEALVSSVFYMVVSNTMVEASPLSGFF
jgi:hypothetical protein